MTEPREPAHCYEPTPPKEFLEQEHWLDLKYGHEYSIQDLAAMLPEGLNIDALRVKVCSRDDGCDCYEYTRVYYVTLKRNAQFKSAMNAYEKDLKKYHERKIVWEQEVKQFLEDVKQYLAWCKKEGHYVNVSYYNELKRKYRDIK